MEKWKEDLAQLRSNPKPGLNAPKQVLSSHITSYPAPPVLHVLPSLLGMWQISLEFRPGKLQFVQTAVCMQIFTLGLTRSPILICQQAKFIILGAKGGEKVQFH